jgi:hypothetical protein
MIFIDNVPHSLNLLFIYTKALTFHQINIYDKWLINILVSFYFKVDLNYKNNLNKEVSKDTNY